MYVQQYTAVETACVNSVIYVPFRSR